MFKSNFKEQRVIEIKNVKFNVFRMMLLYVYDSHIPLHECQHPQELLELLCFGELYGMEELCEISTHNFKELLNKENNCEILEELVKEENAFDLLVKSRELGTIHCNKVIEEFILKKVINKDNACRLLGKSEELGTTDCTKLIEDLIVENLDYIAKKDAFKTFKKERIIDFCSRLKLGKKNLGPTYIFLKQPFDKNFLVICE